MMKLEQLVESARGHDVVWNEERAGRVLASARDRRDRRVARGKLARRSLAVAGAAATIVMVLVRGGAAPASASEPTATSAGTMLAAHGLLDGDGGYGRD